MTDQLDLKKLTMNELNDRLFNIQNKLSMVRCMPMPNQQTIELMEFLQYQISEEIRERYSLANQQKPNNKSLTDDEIAKREQKELEEKNRDANRPRPKF